MPSALLMNSSLPNRSSNPVTGLCTLSTESLTPTIPVGTTIHTKCLADELINTASLRYSGERSIYAECAVPQTDCHSGLSLHAKCFADKLRIAESLQ